MSLGEHDQLNEREGELARRCFEDAMRDASPEAPPEERVRAFYEHAKDYCELIDRLADGRPPEFYGTLLRVLSTLCRDILDLPALMSEEDYEECDLDEATDQRISRQVEKAIEAEAAELEQWHTRCDEVAEEETAKHLTSMGLDPQEIEASSDGGSLRAALLWTDLAELYCDLLGGVRRYEIGTEDARRAALWEWRCGFEQHWGDHLLRALLTVYEIRFQLHHE